MTELDTDALAELVRRAETDFAKLVDRYTTAVVRDEEPAAVISMKLAMGEARMSALFDAWAAATGQPWPTDDGPCPRAPQFDAAEAELSAVHGGMQCPDLGTGVFACEVCRPFEKILDDLATECAAEGCSEESCVHENKTTRSARWPTT